MPFIQARGTSFHVAVDGPDDMPTLILSNSLGCTLSMWEPQMAAFSRIRRVVRYDCRGHGGSGVPAGPYSIDVLAQDALTIMDRLGIDRADFCGLSLGGMVGQWLGAKAPDRVRKLVLANTTSFYASPALWLERIAKVSEGGMAAIADQVMAGWLTEGFRTEQPATAERMRAMLVSVPVAGYVATCEALSRLDQRDLVSSIAAPTLIIAGEHDRATPLATAEALRDKLPGAAVTVLPAAHISNVEQPDGFSRAVVDFITA